MGCGEDTTSSSTNGGSSGDAGESAGGTAGGEDGAGAASATGGAGGNNAGGENGGGTAGGGTAGGGTAGADTEAPPIGDPETVSCVDDACVGAEVCCYWPPGEGQSECSLGDGTVCFVEGGLPLICDGGDGGCDPGTVCCWQSSSLICKGTCGASEVQVCDPEAAEPCENGGACSPYEGPELPPGYYVCE